MRRLPLGDRRLRSKRVAFLASLVVGSCILLASAADAAPPPLTSATAALFYNDPLNTLTHPTTAVLSLSTPDYGGRAAASASFGRLGTDAAVSFNDFRATAAFLAAADATFRDNLTIMAPVSGTVVFSIMLEGSASTNVPGIVMPRLQFGLTAYNDLDVSHIDVSSTRDGFVNGVLRARPMNFVSGAPVTLSVTMLADVLQIAPSLGGPLLADVSYGNTAVLSGIEVFDEFGASVLDFTITSDSGTAYGRYGVLGSPTMGVPEPGVWIMLIGGFALSGSAVRWRRRNLRRLPGVGYPA